MVKFLILLALILAQAREHRAYLPFVAGGDNERPGACSPNGKKGTWGPLPPAAQTEACLDWVFGDGAVPAPGVEFRQYLYDYWQTVRAENGDISLTQTMLLLNEPDRSDWDWQMWPISEHVSLFERGLALCDQAQAECWGPCVSQGGLPYLDEFLSAYQAEYGSPPRVAGSCIHCYGTAAYCQSVVEDALATATSHGLPERIAVTELGYGPAFEGAERGVEETGAFIRWLDNDPRVSFWAYWPGIRDERFAGTEEIWPYLWSTTQGWTDGYGESFAFSCPERRETNE